MVVALPARAVVLGLETARVRGVDTVDSPGTSPELVVEGGVQWDSRADKTDTHKTAALATAVQRAALEVRYQLAWYLFSSVDGTARTLMIGTRSQVCRSVLSCQPPALVSVL